MSILILLFPFFAPIESSPTANATHRGNWAPEFLFIEIGRNFERVAGSWKAVFGAMKNMTDNLNYIELAAEIVSAYVSNNSVPASDLPGLLSDVHVALMRVSTGTTAPAPEAAKPAVPPKKSITNDYIVCLEDGRKFKSLKRHLRTQYNMSPEEYREKWSLPPDYPMVAPAYAKARSALAKQMGLGQQRRRRTK
jgi:predicted transcriptional regulator